MQSILVLQLSRLGDLVQTVPLLRRLRRDHPSARITLACLQAVSGIVADCDYFDTLITLELRDLDGLGTDAAAREAFPNVAPFDAVPAFRERHDLLINLTNDLGAAVVCEKVEAARKFGRVNTYEGELRLLGPWSKYLFSVVSHRPENLFNVVDIQMGIAGLTPGSEPASLAVSAEHRREAEELLLSLGAKPGRKRIALQSGASELHRAWSLDNFAALGRMLLADGHADLVLMGDGRERERTEQLAEKIGLPVINVAGKTPLPLMPAVMRACDLLVSNDTGTIHVAAAVGTRTLGLYFSTAYFSETAPYGDGHAVLQVEIPCAPCSSAARCPVQLCREFLPPDAVRETVRWLLDGISKPPPWRPNLSLYQSRFLSNGSMIYFPVRPEHVSGHYLAGLLGRLLWEGALGLARDPQLDSLWESARGKTEWGRKREELSLALANLAGPMRQGLALAEKLRAEFASDAPSRERILFLHEQLTRLSGSMAAVTKEAGPWGAFLQFEMMDMDYSTYPHLAELLEDKYRGLDDWIRRFEAALARLSPT